MAAGGCVAGLLADSEARSSLAHQESGGDEEDAGRGWRTVRVVLNTRGNLLTLDFLIRLLGTVITANESYPIMILLKVTEFVFLVKLSF